MNDMLGSVRRSLIFRTPDGDGDPGTLVDKISSCIRKSRVFSRPSSFLPSLPQPVINKQNDEQVPVIRWRKGEIIGCGGFGQVYMGMNLDSGELLAVKQVLWIDFPGYIDFSIDFPGYIDFSTDSSMDVIVFLLKMRDQMGRVKLLIGFRLLFKSETLSGF